MRGGYKASLSDTLYALRILGVDVNAAPSRREADVMFEQVKNEILAVGFDEILAIPRARDPRTDLAIALLNDAGEFLVVVVFLRLNISPAGHNASWSTGEGFADVIGLTVCSNYYHILYGSELIDMADSSTRSSVSISVLSICVP